MTTSRRLAAILAADVAGYSRLMAADEVGTLAALKAARREVVDPAIAEHNGRIVKTTGDGMLVEFASAVDAVTCAMAVQEQMAARGGALAFRIGINVGDIIIDGDDIFGDGVNVAARVEGECQPGGVYLSDDAFRQVRAKTSFSFDDLGERSLKNIDRPIRVYAVRLTLADPTNVTPPETGKPLALPDKPSIAVLPFQNMSGDPEQEYFADGMVEDIVTALSRFKSLFVIARNSSFTYKGKAVDIKQVGRELGVRYVLEGSVRKAGRQIRINAQLIEAATGTHLWADKLDGPYEEVFELQDRVTGEVVAQIAPNIEQAEVARSRRKSPEDLDAYDLFLRGRESESIGGREQVTQALAFYYRALERDPGLVPAMAGAANCYNARKTNGWIENDEQETAETARLVDLVLRLGRDDAFALARVAAAAAFVLRRYLLADELIERALLLNPNDSFAWRNRAYVDQFRGRHDAAIEAAKRSIRLSPRDPRNVISEGAMAWPLVHLGKYDEACEIAARASATRPHWALMWRVLAAAHAHAGRMTEARAAMQQVMLRQPDLRLSSIRQWIGFENPADVERMIEGYRLAGMPE